MTNLEALKLRQSIARRLLDASDAVDIALLENPNMAVDPKVATLIAEFDAATDKVAARIQALISKPSTGLSTEDQAALQAEVDKLNTMGQDPANPLPPAVA